MLGLILQPYLPTFSAIPLSIAHTFTHMHASCTTETPAAIISLSSLLPPFAIGTFIAVGVGVGVFLLFVMVIMVVIILVAVFVKRKAVYKQKRDTTMRDNPHCSNTVVAEQEIELKEKGGGADYEDADGYENADGYEDIDNDRSEDEGPLTVGFDPNEVVDKKVHIKNVKRSGPKESFPPASATSVPDVLQLVRAKRVLHHSSQPPSPGNDQYEMVDEAEKRAPPGAVVYEEVDKQDTQTDGHTKHYQELDLAKMERREYASIKV